jgi:hypothetical protein
MSRPTFSMLVVGAFLAVAAMPVLATTCYEVIDRSDVVIFRATRSPVDLSDKGAPARAAMRSRGELLVIFDVGTCVVFGRTSATGSRTLTADEIVAEFQPFAGKSGWGTYSSRVGGSPALAQGPAPAPSRGPSMPSGY